MNAKNLRLVAKRLARSRTFDQTMWVNHCGTPACIAGHAAACSLKDGEKLVAGVDPLDAWVCKPHGRKQTVEARARAFLGLTGAIADKLFGPWPESKYGCWPEPFRGEWAAAGDDIKKQRAVAVRYLRHLADNAEASP